MTPGGKQLADVRKEVEDALARELLEKLAALERRFTEGRVLTGCPAFPAGHARAGNAGSKDEG